MNNKDRRGRPSKKPDYDAVMLMDELLDTVEEVYREKGEIKATATELSLPPNKVKKLLITAGVLNYPEMEKIQFLLNHGRTMAEVREKMGLCYSAIQTYLPYTKVIYKMSEVSQNAERAGKYRERKAAVEKLGVERCEGNLWNCVVAFQNYPFHTSTGLPFSYTLKTGRDGKSTKELIESRKGESKTLTRSSVMLAFHKVMGQRETVFTGPKAIGQIFGISYIYSLFWRFGVIKAPGAVEERMK